MTDGDRNRAHKPTGDDTVAFRDLPEGTIMRSRDGSTAEMTGSGR